MAETEVPTRDYRDTVFLPKTDFPMKAGLAQKEPAILARWAADDLYGQLRAARADREKFILHDGPPYANGDIHMGHAMNKVLKDIVVRSQSLLGKDAPYVPGWDCHGLPIEWKVEEGYRQKKLSKDEVPVEQFRAECRAYAGKWVDIQRPEFERLGVMGDWADPYLTMNFSAEAAIVGELLKFAENGQLYRGAKPVMWSPVEKTALAEAEVEYEDIVSTQIDVAFEIVESPIPELVGAHAVIWTTTPWTMPVNQAIAYGPEVEYVLVTLTGGMQVSAHPGDWGEHLFGQRLLLAEPLIHQFFGRQFVSNIKVNEHWRGKGSDLAGTFARHPIYNFLRHPGESRDPASFCGDEGSGAPDQVRGDGSPLPFRGGVGGRGSPNGLTSDQADRPHPNPASGRSGPRPDLNRSGSGLPDAPEGEGLRSAEFFARPRPFLPGEFVTTDQGTGLVHMAPDHGEDDFELCKAHGIDPVFAVEGDGKYRADWAWLGGQGSVINPKFNAPDGPVCRDLRAAGGLLAASADYRHSYPHSWRSKAKLIFRATPQWFIPMDVSLSHREREGAPQARKGEGDAPSSSGRPHPSHASGAGPFPLPMGEGTLRQTALAAIDATRWVPAKSRNRIRAMVEQRPDWVISRQRAWGVPIALYVNRATGDYLRDPAVNARIVAAFEAGGADAWFTADHQALLGPDHALADYEPVNDILDVWFDSGSTHVFVVEARYGAGARADLYVEGSDQHRGWFQSSLLESCGTRGVAPYDAVLTHGFALDADGRKMSKSLGNVVDPLKVIGESGADILRLWVASTDYFEDVRIGKQALAGTGDAYRKLRNTFRYLLGALDGWDEAERIDYGEMPELERYILHLVQGLDEELRAATMAFAFDRYARALSTFCNDDLSAFLFDIRKDSLYCDAAASPKRRAYRTVLDVLFHALVRWAAPILCFTAEEAWGTRYPERGSVHLLEWPGVDPDWRDSSLADRWSRMRELRELVTREIEPKRRAKELGSSNEAKVTIGFPDVADRPIVTSEELAELFIVSDVGQETVPHGPVAIVHRTDYRKCGRCWRHLPEVADDGALCARCEEVVNG